ncbi:hypothetical protein N865_18230 [Intrasporangium oryzae NRRL B-24470]|uniref:DUF881 domain-containing protein n=1 Tax=Intrasporangium oryzae NRRL B-24470 TaxID=1386089 RepID=W9G1Y2_9MICO|nr:DUF881 domain-containing protein [Intrasporangium oryzae]EWT00091.1 hypothetical protein N865_18230 [Intrasporangium oryzae NRRL B-24470]
MTTPVNPTGSSNPERRPDASMTLLTSMLERPLDPGYQEAADRRTAAGLPAATSTRTVIVVVLAILTGFLFATAAQALRPKPTAAAAAKAELVRRIESLQAEGTAQEAKIAALGRQVQDYEALALRQSGGADLSDTLKKLEVRAGAVPVTGPGLTLTVDDAPGDPNADAGSRPTTGFDSGQVSAADLQIVVNGLWGAGAEAISINGHRLTSTAAIRFAGQAIIVDFRPLARPYVITTIGDPDRMQKLFEPSFAGVYLSQLNQQFGIRSSLAASDHLTVPGDSAVRLEVARPLGSDVGSPTSRPSTSDRSTPTPSPAPADLSTDLPRGSVNSP